MIGGPAWQDIPDTDNDEVMGSLGARDSPNKGSSMGEGELYPK